MKALSKTAFKQILSLHNHSHHHKNSSISKNVYLLEPISPTHNINDNKSPYRNTIICFTSILSLVICFSVNVTVFFIT